MPVFHLVPPELEMRNLAAPAGNAVNFIFPERVWLGSSIWDRSRAVCLPAVGVTVARPGVAYAQHRSTRPLNLREASFLRYLAA